MPYHLNSIIFSAYMPDYHVGSSLSWSDLFWFKTFPSGSNWKPRLAIFGDMGNVNAQSLPRLQRETQEGMYDAFLHVGDFAYNLDTVKKFCKYQLQKVSNL